MSDPDEAFVQKLSENLFQQSQYKFNSGGEPKDITDLTYDDLKKFHTAYYHPSNSQIFTYGDMDFTQHLDFVQNQVLKGQTRNTECVAQSQLVLEQKRGAPLFTTEKFMPDLMQEEGKQAKLGLAFLCDLVPAENPYEAFALQILSTMLLEGPNAPFYKSIIEADKAPGFCPYAGLDHTSR